MLTSLIPIGDDNTGRNVTPYVTYTLIAINVAVFFLLQVSDSAFTYGYSVVPREITQHRDLIGPIFDGQIYLTAGPHPIYLTILTAMFMHGGLAHLGGNMLYLWIFGDNVEDALGHAKFLIFYLICGVAATAAHILSQPMSTVPSLGASGAIAGVLGGYLLMFPTKRIRVLFGIGILTIIQLPAFIVVGFWILLQFVNGIGSIAHTEQTSGVAYWAHIGGAVTGLLLVSLFRNRETTMRIDRRMNAGEGNFPSGRY